MQKWGGCIRVVPRADTPWFGGKVGTTSPWHMRGRWSHPRTLKHHSDLGRAFRSSGFGSLHGGERTGAMLSEETDALMGPRSHCTRHNQEESHISTAPSLSHQVHLSGHAYRKMYVGLCFFQEIKKVESTLKNCFFLL